jgi:hypothetical protein
MKAQSVALMPSCAECGARWLPADPERWRAYLGCDEYLDEPAELVILCAPCAEREFGGSPVR